MNEHEPGGAGVRAVEPRASPERGGFCRMRMTVKTTIATRTATAKKSSRKRNDQAHWSMIGIANSRSNSAPYASRIVNPRTMKPQNVKKCATPGRPPLQQLALAEDLDGLGLQAHTLLVGAPHRRLARADRLEDLVAAPRGQRQGSEREQHAQHQTHGEVRLGERGGFGDVGHHRRRARGPPGCGELAEEPTGQ